ncbi:hypothetical protein BpHYR1_041280 [Brachionus plicatilis]|uniref:Uncharacterized protein n=1 Tax=Brachionus plicatilis TaxID=10195 RepID=A0A3M7PPB3_BRAPC|nr:hypothetical protein BpHYR1_041280 [Brachionus plicatilis]
MTKFETFSIGRNLNNKFKISILNNSGRSNFHFKVEVHTDLANLNTVNSRKQLRGSDPVIKSSSFKL